MSARYMELATVTGGRKGSNDLERGQEANPVRVSARNTGTLGAETFQVQQCPTAALLYKPISSEEIRL